ncbi:telomere repeat-binding protein 4-like [Rutidosis leptorrhynchoides]|uniref:telomere repeat-binding protein 4-like n=1 Tax=Rutidosis leptorrhynchoides TaxID=125765 RepID=UPI003A9A2C46
MVAQKKLYYGGFDGFRAPVVPKAPRSVRRNSSVKKWSVGTEICPFELLAAVAGKLLQESESSASASSTGPEGKEDTNVPKSVVKQEPLEAKVKVKPTRLDYIDQGCFGESELVPEPPNLELKLDTSLKDQPQSDNESGLEHASIVTTSDFIKEADSTVKFESSDGKNEVNCSHGGLYDINMDTNTAKVQTEAVEKLSDNLTAVKSYVNNSVLNKSYSSVHRRNVKIGIRDDDENYFSYNHRSTKMKAFRLQSHGGNRRIRKMLTTKWKAAPKLKDYEPSNTTCLGVKTFDPSRKNIYKREHYQADIASKRRKLFHHSSKPDYIQETSSGSISNIPETSVSGDKRRPSAAVKNKEKAVTSSALSHKNNFQSKEGHVRFCIKSFKVPELHVEMADTSTVGSLKRNIMEAVTAILGGELDIGVLFEGEKIRDDDRTLQQTGISVNSDTLGFILEPSLPQRSQSLEEDEPPLMLTCDNNQLLVSYPDSPVMDVGFLNSTVDTPQSSNLDNQFEKDQESKPLTSNVLTEEIVANSKAIVPTTPLNPEALSIVPMNHKPSKRSELSQRRTRRPFSVSEVEALVEAVEMLGTGRWRDVKIRAFDDASHRTYVDLKDKWKTLVHTASISPQQRRGEPVPQNLLDRVLAAHSFWSQHQYKQHGKHQIKPIQTQVEVCM